MSCVKVGKETKYTCVYIVYYTSLSHKNLPLRVPITESWKIREQKRHGAFECPVRIDANNKLFQPSGLGMYLEVNFIAT